jgi:molybdopterin-synthase adenylyltransferase
VVRRLLDCDVVISTTDTQSSRALLNQIAYQYWLPTIDVGVRVGTKQDGAVSGMPAEVRVLLPDNACLWCRRGVLDSQVIYEENLPPDARQRLAAEGYVQGLAQHQPSLTPLNYFAGAAAVLIMLKLQSGQPVIAASVVFDAWEQFVQPLRAEPDPACICQQWRGRGDDVPVAFLPRGAL